MFSQFFLTTPWGVFFEKKKNNNKKKNAGDTSANEPSQEGECWRHEAKLEGTGGSEAWSPGILFSGKWCIPRAIHNTFAHFLTTIHRCFCHLAKPYLVNHCQDSMTKLAQSWNMVEIWLDSWLTVGIICTTLRQRWANVIQIWQILEKNKSYALTLGHRWPNVRANVFRCLFSPCFLFMW